MLSCLWPIGQAGYISSLRGAKRRSNPVLVCGSGLLRLARNDGGQSFSGQATDVLNDAGEIDPAMSCGIERLVDLLGKLAERRRSTGGLGRILRQREVLDHQG